VEAGRIDGIRVYPDPDALARALSGAVAAELRNAVAVRGAATLVLAGGNTPAAAYRRLAADGDVPWDRVEFLFGDERCVPPHDPASNYRLARETLFEPVGIDPACVHRMQGELPPAEAAEAYERELRGVLGDAPPDLVLLGLGTDGHTASLFPGSPALDETRRWVVPTESPAGARHRISLTYPVLNRARHAWFTVSGADKAETAARVLAGEDLPAARVRPGGRNPVWWMDQDAARRVRPRT